MKTRLSNLTRSGCNSRTSLASGLTLIEILCASMNLAISVVVLLALNRTSILNYSRGQAYEQAWRLADECLDRLSGRGVRILLPQQKLEGDFTPRYSNYRYILTCKPASSENLYKVTVQIHWQENETDQFIETSTYLYDFEPSPIPSPPAPLPAESPTSSNS